MRNDTRGVSEILGYILVFSLVMATVAIVTVGGVGQLENARDAEQLNNAERAFDLLAGNVDDIAKRGAPSRATEISLADAQMAIDEPAEFTVRGVDDEDPVANNFTESYDVSPIVYRASGDTEIVYSGGTVFRVDRGGGISIRDPAIVARDNYTVVPVIQTRSRNVQSRGGGTIRVQTDHSQTRILKSDTDTTYEHVFVNVTSPRAAIWGEMLGEYEAFECTPDTSGAIDQVRCEATGVDRVHIPIIQIDVELTD